MSKKLYIFDDYNPRILNTISIFEKHNIPYSICLRETEYGAKRHIEVDEPEMINVLAVDSSEE